MSLAASYSLNASQQAAFEAVIEDWRTHDKVARLWRRDATLWTGSGEDQWLGWLDVVDRQRHDLKRFGAVASEVRRRGFSSIVLLGMGGSSLCPEVLSQSFGREEGFPPLLVLDSTDPAQVLAIEGRVDLARTLFIVSSKSGSTLEPNIFLQYFYERAGKAGGQFFAITDPASKLEQVAGRDAFAQVFYGEPSIGGRFSALSDFGMIPAAAMGLDVERLLEGAYRMSRACAAAQAANPGLALGALLGSLGLAGRNKVTLVASPRIRDLGAWLEQLLAESTGKEGKGLIPVDRESLVAPDGYGDDRVFIYQRLEGGADAAQDAAVAALEAAGQPVIRIPVEGPYQLAAEFFRWEFATAVAGSILKINPFDQPDVEASKVATRKLTSAFEETGSLPEEAAALEEDGLALYGEAGGGTLEQCLRAHFSDLPAGGYVALLAYLEMNQAHEAALQAIRDRIRRFTGAASCLGFGPRFLHSTGQAYKGGPPGGVFLQITAADAHDVAVPGQRYTFGVVKAAQAQGDLEVLRERSRRALRVHLRAGVEAGLAQLATVAGRALQ